MVGVRFLTVGVGGYRQAREDDPCGGRLDWRC